MFGLTDAACDGNYCCYNSDCATSWCQSGGGFNCKCEEEWFKGRYGTGSCRSKISDGRRAHHSGLGNTPDYDSCVARDGTCAAYPTLSHRSVRLHHPHFILSCPGVVSADEGESQTAISVARTPTANQATALVVERPGAHLTVPASAKPKLPTASGPTVQASETLQTTPVAGRETERARPTLPYHIAPSVCTTHISSFRAQVWYLRTRASLRRLYV